MSIIAAAVANECIPFVADDKFDALGNESDPASQLSQFSNGHASKTRLISMTTVPSFVHRDSMFVGPQPRPRVRKQISQTVRRWLNSAVRSATRLSRS